MRRWLVPLLGLLAVVGLAVVLLRGQVPEMAPPPAPAPAPTERSNTVPPFITSADISSRGTAYGLITECTDIFAGRCTYELAVSRRDGTWSRRPTPQVRSAGQSPIVREVVAFDRAVVLTQWSPFGVPQAWVSRDGGRRWGQVGVGALIDRIPDGSTVRQPCRFGGTPCDPRLQVITPAGISLLSTAPPLDVDHAVGVPIGGEWWLAGRIPGTRQPAVASSPDGRDWTVTALPTPGADEPRVTVGGSGAVRYAAVTSNHVVHGQAVRGLHRSDDGGRTWTLVHRPEPAQLPIATIGAPAAGPDGRLTLGSERKGDVHVSTDGGRTFAIDFDVAPLPFITLTRGGYLSPRGGGRVQFSPDGVRWREVDFGLD